jgi:DMSO reductase anchor subunit
MCYDRLIAGEAPVCVQSCPNEAIRIRTVAMEAVIEDSESNQFLPSAPDPGITLPSTAYKTNRSLPRNLLPADYYFARPQHSHLALVCMLVLTQMSVGAFCVGQTLVSGPWSEPMHLALIRPAHAVAGLLMGLIGLGAAVFHLGRPQLAFRALLGLATSWLSREILAFGVFAGWAVAAALSSAIAATNAALVPLADVLAALAAASGLVAVGCSVMIYVRTNRPFWSGARTSLKFFGTAVVLGLPLALLVSLAACALSDAISVKQVMRDYGYLLCRWLAMAVAAKLLLEAGTFLHLRDTRFTPLRRSAILMAGDLKLVTLLRFFFGCVGGLLLPFVLLSETQLAQSEGFHPLFVGVAVLLVFAIVSIGEFLERYLFFAASASSKMPGSTLP